MGPTKDTRQLTWLLAWAVVFCDIGTSVYYVPGILYGSVGDKTPFFILLTSLGFIPLALKYIEITWRNPEGGGVATITTKAFGLKSISQLSPNMRLPLRKTTRRAMIAVIGTMLLTSPLLSILSINLLPSDFKSNQSERFISEIASLTGGFSLKLALVFSASCLLLFAANTAIIGAYHIFLALANSNFLPRVIGLRSERFNSPHIAIPIATLVPVIVIVATQGEIGLLGELYAFGLLGAFLFSSLSLDIIRSRLGRRDIGFWIASVLTTVMILLAWSVNLVAKELATMFGGALTIIGMAIAVGVRHSWFVDILHQIPAIQRLQARAYLDSEALVVEELRGLVTLADAVELKALYPGSSLLALRGENPALIQQGINLARGKGESALYCIYVEEWPGLFNGNTPHRPNEEGIRTLRHAVQQVREKNIEVIPIWTVSHNAAEAITHAAKALDVDGVLIGQSRRSAFYHMLRGHAVEGLTKKLPHDCHLMIFN
jgi:hypothetical protein